MIKGVTNKIAIEVVCTELGSVAAQVNCKLCRAFVSKEVMNDPILQFYIACQKTGICSNLHMLSMASSLQGELQVTGKKAR